MRMPAKAVSFCRCTCFLCAWLLLTIHPGLAWGKERKNVLVLHNFNQDYPAVAAFDLGLRETFASEARFDVRFFAEYLNLEAYENLPAYQPEAAHYLRLKYSHVRPDAVFADNAVTPMIAHHLAGLFDGVPLLVQAEKDAPGGMVAPGMTAMSWAVSEEAIDRNFELIERLLPQVRRVVVVLGASSSEARMGAAVRAAAARHAGRLLVETTQSLGLDAMLDKVGSLERDTAVLAVRFGRDAAGNNHIPARVMRQVAERASVPVFGVDRHVLGNGMVGGYSHAPRLAGRLVGTWMIGLFDGRTDAKTPEFKDFLIYAFDARALARWDIPESALPPGSEVTGRRESLWAGYKFYILGGGLLFAAQTALVVGLVVNRLRRRRAETALAALNASLEERVMARTRELHEANEELHDAKEALENLNASLERLSRTDSLTGLPNRRRAEEALHEALVRFRRYGHGFVVAMADIDHFKQINDAIGHDAGDAALRHAARAIAGSLRETDLVARWGGEEFLLLMPDTEEAGASRLLARICDCLASAAPGCAGLSAPLTATFGAAGIRPGESLEKLLRRADQALYRGKAMGRNRVVWDAGDGGENVVL